MGRPCTNLLAQASARLVFPVFKEVTLTGPRLDEDALLGLGILQVITKHWFEGRFPVEMWSFWIYPLRACNNAGLICMLMFFILSGHTAAGVTKWTARLERWLGLYMLMTLTALPAFQTDSMRIDWFFLWLLAAEIMAVGISAASKLLPTSSQSQQILSAAVLVFALIAAAAWTADHSHLDSRYFEIATGWGCSPKLRLTDSWCNLLFGNIDLKFGTWRGGQLCLWAAGFGLGFFALPRLSQELWAKPFMLHVLSRPPVRILALLMAVWLVVHVPAWPYDAELPWWPWPVEPTFRVNLIRATVAFGHALAAVVTLAVAVGPTLGDKEQLAAAEDGA
ncbi:unnamed protein product [Symbiodinium natans]|uniref:Uncharacterized protein n=1 Tax=Symbiodinium natans TaxID=878477 RepID=A0A812K394_9DINO|nr:unnamed protein product [Symbiodinium natans]